MGGQLRLVHVGLRERGREAENENLCLFGLAMKPKQSTGADQHAWHSSETNRPCWVWPETLLFS